MDPGGVEDGNIASISDITKFWDTWNTWNTSHQKKKETLEPEIPHLIWVCLKMGYTPNYSHLVGIMIITIGFFGVHYFQTNPYAKNGPWSSQVATSPELPPPDPWRPRPGHVSISTGTSEFMGKSRMDQLHKWWFRGFQWDLNLPWEFSRVFGGFLYPLVN